MAVRSCPASTECDMSVWASVCQCRTIVTTGATIVMIMTTGVKMTAMAKDVMMVVVAEDATK